MHKGVYAGAVQFIPTASRAGKHSAKTSWRPAVNQRRCSPDCCASSTWLFCLSVPLGISASATWTCQISSVLAWGSLHHVLCNLNVPLKTKLICLTCRRENASWLASIGLIKWDCWKTKTCQSLQWLCRQQYLGRHWKAGPSEHPIFCPVKRSRLFFAGCNTCKSRDQQTVKKLFPRGCSQWSGAATGHRKMWGEVLESEKQPS